MSTPLNIEFHMRAFGLEIHDCCTAGKKHHISRHCMTIIRQVPSTFSIVGFLATKVSSRCDEVRF